jgi:hypothetical protein
MYRAAIQSYDADWAKRVYGTSRSIWVLRILITCK